MESAGANIISQDDPEKMEAQKRRPNYSSPVRIFNWNEDLYLEEERFKITRYKYDHSQLLVQKTCKMFKNVLTPVLLEKETSFVLYGSVYQLEACDLSNKVVPETGYKATNGLYMSGLMNERDIEIAQHFIHGCGLTASPDKEPCARNTFVFVGCNGEADGQTIYYGDNVYIQITKSGTDDHLFVQCQNSTYDDFGEHLKLMLTQSPDFYCIFKIYHWNPQLRKETIGSGLAPNSKVVIQHSASGQNLAVEYRHWIPTFFGAECVLSCHTYRDSHKTETAENMWKVVGDTKPNFRMQFARSE